MYYTISNNNKLSNKQKIPNIILHRIFLINYRIHNSALQKKNIRNEVGTGLK